MQYLLLILFIVSTLHAADPSYCIIEKKEDRAATFANRYIISGGRRNELCDMPLCCFFDTIMRDEPLEFFKQRAPLLKELQERDPIYWLLLGCRKRGRAFDYFAENSAMLSKTIQMMQGVDSWQEAQQCKKVDEFLKTAAVNDPCKAYTGHQSFIANAKHIALHVKNHFADDAAAIKQYLIAEKDKFATIASILEQEHADIVDEHADGYYTGHRKSRPRPTYFDEGLLNMWDDNAELQALRKAMMGSDSQKFDEQLRIHIEQDFTSVSIVGWVLEMDNYGLNAVLASDYQEIKLIQEITTAMEAREKSTGKKGVLSAELGAPLNIKRAVALMHLYHNLDDLSHEHATHRLWDAVVGAYEMFGDLHEPEKSQRVEAHRALLFEKIDKMQTALSEWKITGKWVNNPDATTRQKYVWVERAEKKQETTKTST